ncbi:hypothetical protein [Winogradskyella sp.]|uniref:hypothetical protein n=1 Tax=Winogradskyella sp. TaxID=1883156 RepID=UPI00262D1C67|nr:hypothetical protein [Winogradskyella sp.]
MTYKSIFLSCILSVSFQISYGQTSIETFSSEDNFIVEAWWYKVIEANPKFNVFSLNEAIHNYGIEETFFMNYTIVGYEISKGFGPVAGARFLSDRVSGLAGIQYAYYTPIFFITTNITGELRSNPLFEWYTLLQYRPKLTEKLKLFAQFQNAMNFDESGNDFSLQRLRVGLDFKWLQAGFALNTTQTGKDWDFDAEPGLFLRLELN